MSGQNPREIAARILGRRKTGRYVEDLLEEALAQSRLSAPDRRLCQELVYGVVRWQAALDWLISRKAQKRLPPSGLQNLLRLGLYQVFWLERIPEHAAVHQTVELARQNGFGRQAGFVNALLRGYLREKENTRRALEQLKTVEPHLGYSHPEWLVQRWQARWGRETTARLLAWNNTPPATYARVNTLKTDPGKLLERWREENVDYDFVRRDWLEENLVFGLKSHPPLHRLASFQEGWFYIQDPSTLLAVHKLAPQPGERVLDLCAAPGGKLTYIAQLMRNEGVLVAHDFAPERLKLIQENCARLGVTIAQPVCWAETAPPPREREALKNQSPSANSISARSFDRILVDAPCSNTGVVRRRVELRWRLRLEEIARLRQIQLRLLDQASSLLKLGGRLVYSTCSLEPEENETVVKEFLLNHPGFELQGQRELLPFEHEVDGAYVAAITRTRR